MKQDDKELLLRDLCSRLPYGVKVKTILEEPYTLKGLFDTEYGGVMGCLLGKYVPNNVSPKTTNYPLLQFKPYLFPLSSMTEEQEEKYGEYYDIDLKNSANNLKDRLDGKDVINGYPMYNHIDWLNRNHFDYRGLIEKGLAIDATGLNIY
jgi:hypothetical protein